MLAQRVKIRFVEGFAIPARAPANAENEEIESCKFLLCAQSNVMASSANARTTVTSVRYRHSQGRKAPATQLAPACGVPIKAHAARLAQADSARQFQLRSSAVMGRRTRTDDGVASPQGGRYGQRAAQAGGTSARRLPAVKPERRTPRASWRARTADFFAAHSELIREPACSAGRRAQCSIE